MVLLSSTRTVIEISHRLSASVACTTNTTLQQDGAIQPQLSYRQRRTHARVGRVVPTFGSLGRSRRDCPADVLGRIGASRESDTREKSAQAPTDSHPFTRAHGFWTVPIRRTPTEWRRSTGSNRNFVTNSRNSSSSSNNNIGSSGGGLSLSLSAAKLVVRARRQARGRFHGVS